MKKLIAVIVIGTMATAVIPEAASAKGCLRGAAAGAVAGHYAHHHAVAGAVAGCVIARHHYKHKAAARQHMRAN
jgi:hypothetical protein